MDSLAQLLITINTENTLQRIHLHRSFNEEEEVCENNIQPPQKLFHVIIQHRSFNEEVEVCENR